MADAARAFLDRSAHLLENEFLPRVEGAVAPLTPADLWWRPNPASNSAGNLLLHLAGNLRQWVVSGVGGAPDERTRDAEFSATDGPGTDLLLERLGANVTEAGEVLRRFPADGVLERRRIQERDTTVMDAVYHAVEHFSMHTGQIVYIAKLRLGKDLGFYRLVDGQPRPTWEGAKGI